MARVAAGLAVAWAAAATSPPAVAQGAPEGEPTTRPQREREFRPGVGMGGGPGMGGRFPVLSGPRPAALGLGPVSREPPDEEEWGEITAFMAKHSPNRLGMVERMIKDRSGDERFVERVKGRTAARYRALREVEAKQEDLHKFALEQFRLEDQILGVIRDARQGGNEAESAAKLGKLLDAFVENGLKEREERVRVLASLVEAERRRLERDRSNRSDLVERARRKFEHDYRRLPGDGDEPQPPSPPSPRN